MGFTTFKGTWNGPEDPSQESGGRPGEYTDFYGQVWDIELDNPGDPSSLTSPKWSAHLHDADNIYKVKDLSRAVVTGDTAQVFLLEAIDQWADNSHPQASSGGWWVLLAFAWLVYSDKKGRRR